MYIITFVRKNKGDTMIKARLYVIAFDGTGGWKITSEKRIMKKKNKKKNNTDNKEQ